MVPSNSKPLPASGPTSVRRRGTAVRLCLRSTRCSAMATTCSASLWNRCRAGRTPIPIPGNSAQRIRTGPMNEPDVPDYVQGPQVGPTQYVRMLDTLETQLQAYGLGNIPLVGPDTASPGIGVDSYVPAMLADPFLMPHVLQFGFHTYGASVSDAAITNNTTYPGRQIITDEYDGQYFNEDHGQRATPSQLWTQADGSFQNLVGIIGHGENGALIWDGVDNFYE